MEYFQYQGEYRDSYYMDREGRPIQLKDGAALNMRISVAGTLYWDNRFHLDNDMSSQVRATGWQWEAGLRVPYLPIEVYEHHHSRHILDRESPRNDKFPLENTVGVRIRFIGGGK